jgi:hypothetical protein
MNEPLESKIKNLMEKRKDRETTVEYLVEVFDASANDIRAALKKQAAQGQAGASELLGRDG